MDIEMRGITAKHITAGQNSRIGDGSRIHAGTVVLGDDVSIAENVTIACDELYVGSGTRIGAGAVIVSPTIRLGEQCAIGPGFAAELNESFQCGRLSDVGQSTRITGHRFLAGDHLWLTDHVTIGGGGARGPRSSLTIGDRCAIMDRCYINLSDSVTIGDDTALSNAVTILTHSLWQPVLAGGTSQFAPVRIGSRCIVYVNAVIVPGVTIGSDSTIGAGALVMQDVPDASTALGNPARVMRSTPPVPREVSVERQDAIVRDILNGWVETLPVKGVRAKFTRPDELDVESATEHDVVQYIAQTDRIADATAATVTLAFGTPDGRAACHLDLAARTITGRASALVEDLRDYLRRRTIRIYSDRPFSSLRPASVARLRRALQQN